MRTPHIQMADAPKLRRLTSEEADLSLTERIRLRREREGCETTVCGVWSVGSSATSSNDTAHATPNENTALQASNACHARIAKARRNP